MNPSKLDFDNAINTDYNQFSNLLITYKQKVIEFWHKGAKLW